MKPTSTFRLTKPTKTFLALGKFINQDQRNSYKAMMIQAQLESNVKISRSKSDTGKE
jgi:hypothetical protein